MRRPWRNEDSATDLGADETVTLEHAERLGDGRWRAAELLFQRDVSR
jgi:hypothetical protein